MKTLARPDEDARRRILDDLDANLFVEAGAGTGKTTALVGRVVRLVATGRARASELAAITFTEAAAAELRERIRGELERTARGETDPPIPHEERRRCDDAIAELDDAPISTLHGFAHRILAEHPFEAGLPPHFEVVDDIEASVAFTRRWHRFVDDVLDEPAMQRPLVVAFAFGLSLSHLEEAARALHLHWDRIVDGPSAPPSVPVIEVDAIALAVDAAVARSDSCCAGEDLLLEHLRSIGVWAAELRSAPDELERLIALADAPTLAPRRTPGRNTNWPGGVKERVAELLRTAQDELDRVVVGAKAAALAAVVDAVRRFTLRSAEERRREGRLEFHDLLVMARDLLRADAEVRAALHGRFRALLLDEFQDTDPLQIELAVLIATDESDVGLRPWHELPVPRGRLFVVGDPKQSIYRFRRADITLYHHVQSEFGGELERLTYNFRSRPGILAWVNHCFDAIMQPAGAETRSQAVYEPLAAHRPSLDDVPVRVLGAADESLPLPELRAHEAAEIAAAIRQIRDEQWPVAAPTPDDQLATRPAELADIAILVPTRTTLGYLETALDQANIPTRVESQSMVFASNEVRTLLAILQAIDDPTDEVAIVAALRSPAFACRDDELVAWKLAGGRFDYRVAPESDVATPVTHGLTALREFHERRTWESVSETVERVVRERRLLELATAESRPRDRWRRTRLVLDAARTYAAGGTASLRGFISWVQQQVDERARVSERVIDEPDDRAVRILTVHGAKGLEFPIVILTGLNVGYHHRPDRVLFDEAGRAELRLGRSESMFETAHYERLRLRDRLGDAAEGVRVLYVAATRARDHLVVSLHHRPGDQSAAELLASGSNTAPALSRRWEPKPSPPSTTDHEAFPVPPDAPIDRAAWISRRADLVARSTHAPAIAATALAKLAAGVFEAPTDDTASVQRLSSPRGPAGTAIGRAVHAALQTIDLATGAALDDTCRAQALAEGVADRESEVRALVQSVLGAPIIRRAAQGIRSWREVPVAVEIDGVLLDGFIDLLLDTPDGLVVVDYKTDHVDCDDEAFGALVARYRIQGAAYALSLEEALQRPVARCIFVFARAGGAVERELGDLRAAIDEARALLAKVVSPRSAAGV